MDDVRRPARRSDRHDRPLTLFDEPGLAVATFAVLVPAIVILARRWDPAGGIPAVELALVARSLSRSAYPVQNDYLDNRYAEGIRWYELDSSYRWAREVRDARIGIAGTTACVATVRAGSASPSREGLALAAAGVEQRGRRERHQDPLTLGVCDGGT